MPSPLPKLNLRTQKLTVALSLLLLATLATATYLLIRQRSQVTVQKINYSQLYEIAEAGSAASLSIQGDVANVKHHDGSMMEAVITSQPAQQEIISLFRKANVTIEFKPLEQSPVVVALNWLVPAASLLLLGFIGWRVYGNMSGHGNFDPVECGGKQNVHFGDVAGVDEAKAELTETIEFLRDPARFGRLGGRVPRGILLAGPPGTGKTLLARAAANEAGVPFLTASGSSFQEKFVGLGAARVRHRRLRDDHRRGMKQ